jgi:hypothetical protein
MRTFDQIEAEVNAAVRSEIAEDIDLSDASSAYSMFETQAAILSKNEQQFDDLQNSWNVNTNVGNAQDLNTGFLINTKRNYINFTLTATITNNSTTTDYSLITAYQALYTNITGSYVFAPILTAPTTIPKNGGSLGVTMIYIGLIFSNLPTIPVNTALTNTDTGIDLTILTTSQFAPIFENDESYRVRQQTVYAVKGYGTINSLRYGLKNNPYVSSSEVYFGTNKTGTTTITGVTNTYVLNPGDILAIIDSPYINNASVLQAIGLQIEELKDVLNVTYSHTTPFGNEIDIVVPLDNGQTVDISFFKAIPNDVMITLVIQSAYALFNDTDITNLATLVNTYIQAQGIGGEFYFNVIADIFSNYFGSELKVKSMSVNDGTTTDDVLVYTQHADQKFFLSKLNILYSAN